MVDTCFKAVYAIPRMEAYSFYQPPCLSVSELTRYVRQLLEGDTLLQEIWVEGEVSNLSRPSSGHCYFTLKDTSAALRCVIWRSICLHLKVMPRDGARIQVHGAVGVYEASGQYQLYVDLVRPAGEGALFQEFIRLKARLEMEGLFDPQRKRPLPGCPGRIGIVTSPSGAALQDILNVLRRRYPLAEVVIAPTPVQGTEAPECIARAIRDVNHLAHPDVILVARGGGSIEDLWAFNDERVARAIVASEAPVITGVGHETDFTIADFAADLRAPTPTAAAELCSPDRADLRRNLVERKLALKRTLSGLINNYRFELEGRQASLNQYSPLSTIRNQRQRLDDLARFMAQALAHSLSLRQAHLEGLDLRLEALNPQAILQRGYAIVTRRLDGRLVKSAIQTQPGDRLDIRLAEGRVEAEVTASIPSPKP